LEDACAFIGLFRETSVAGPIDVAQLTAAFDRLRRSRIDFVKAFSWEASTALLLGGDPVRDNAHKTERPYREKLHRLYVDVPFMREAASV
jgi:salicylate hydroxylase